MAMENVPLPDAPAELRSWLDDVEAETRLWVGRLGGRHYEEVGVIIANPDSEVTRERIIESITRWVELHSSAKFIVCTGEDADAKKWEAGVRWFAFLRTKGSGSDSFGEGELVPASMLRWQTRQYEVLRDELRQERVEYRELLSTQAKSVARMVRGMSRAMKQASKTSRSANKTLREAAAGQQEAMVQVAKIEASSQKFDAILELGKTFLAKRSEERETIAAIQQKVTSVLGDEAAAVREHEAGKEFFAADNATTLRNAGLRVKEAIQAGTLKLSADKVQALMAYVTEIIG